MSKVLTPKMLKKSGDNVALKLMREIKLSECPKCGERVYSKEHDFCGNCSEVSNELDIDSIFNEE